MTSWTERAECAKPNENGADRSPLFFSSSGLDIRAAKRICGECPVRRECLSDALEHGDRFGVWGGVDYHELRRAMSIDSEGHATNRSLPPRCPFCFEKKLTVLVKRRNWWRVACSTCDLEWVLKRVVAPKPTPTPEPTRETSESDNSMEGPVPSDR